jgi:hypothetical protein
LKHVSSQIRLFGALSADKKPLAGMLADLNSGRQPRQRTNGSRISSDTLRRGTALALAVGEDVKQSSEGSPGQRQGHQNSLFSATGERWLAEDLNMPELDADALEQLALLRRQLRDLKGLTESRPGVFTYGGKPFLAFVETEDKALVAEIRNANTGHAAVTRVTVGSAADGRKVIDEARRRLARLTDD